MKLYEIKEQFMTLLDMDIDEQTMSDTLESLQGDFEDKADNIACLIKALEAEVYAIKVEADKLKERASQKQVKADSLKQYLYNTFKTLNMDNIETPRNIIQVKKNPESVEVQDGFMEWAVINRRELLSFKEPTPNKIAIKEAIKNGSAVVGARLVRKERLVIK